MPGRLRGALVGCGRMGRNHARVMREHPAINLAVVVDTSTTPAIDPLPGGAAPAVLHDLREIPALRPDFIVVATPTPTHFAVTRQMLDLKIPLLVEKPVVCSSAEGEELLVEAMSAGTFVAAGHLERMNPAIEKLIEIISAGLIGDLLQLNFTRMGGFPADPDRLANVVLDLAVHDLDILRWIAGPARIVSSVCQSTVVPGIVDSAEILATTDEGVSASFQVSWASAVKIRTLRAVGTAGVCMLDYVNQTCHLAKRGSNGYSAPQLHPESAPEAIESTITSRGEPLRRQLDNFLAAIRGEPNSIATLADGVEAVRLAEAALRNGIHIQRQPPREITSTAA